MTFQPAAHGAVFFFLHAREYAANCNAIVRTHVWNQRSDQEQHNFFFFFTEHIVVFIRALSGSNTEKKWT